MPDNRWKFEEYLKLNIGIIVYIVYLIIIFE